MEHGGSHQLQIQLDQASQPVYQIMSIIAPTPLLCSSIVVHTRNLSPAVLPDLLLLQRKEIEDRGKSMFISLRRPGILERAS